MFKRLKLRKTWVALKKSTTYVGQIQLPAEGL